MKAFTPEVAILPDRKMLTGTVIGDPSHAGEELFPRLYGTAYATRFKVYKPRGLKVAFGKLCAEWPNARLAPREEWIGHWALPVPDFFESEELLQKDEKNPIALEVWPGGKYAQILHKGPYSEEGPTVAMLHDYIENELGIPMKDVPGTHEEEYLTSPDAKEVKTIIRYRISV